MIRIRYFLVSRCAHARSVTPKYYEIFIWKVRNGNDGTTVFGISKIKKFFLKVFEKKYFMFIFKKKRSA